MRRLSDHTGEEAIAMWADLLEPMAAIINDEKIAKSIKSGKNRILIAKDILSAHKKEATEILLRIDDTPIDGLNILIRLANILQEIGESEELKGFFGYAEQEKKESVSSGSATENTEDDMK